MKTKLLAFVTAGAIATSGLTVTSAQAGPNDDLVKFLVGAAIIGVIASEVNKSNQVKKPHVARAPVQPHVVRAPVHQPHRPRVQRPRPQVQVSYNKPNTCLRQRWTQNGWKTFYAKQCMVTRGWERHDGIGWHKHI